MIVPTRYATLVLFLLFGVLGGLFMWGANEWSGELDRVSRPLQFDPQTPQPGSSGKEVVERCPAVVTLAQDPVSKVCQEFATFCDMPQGWMPGCAPVPETPVPTSTPKKPPKNPPPVEAVQ